MTQYSGKVIRKTPVTPTQASASGVWKLNEQAAAIRNNSWPIAGVPDPISRSVRFRSSASTYLNRTPAISGTRTRTTISLWVKRGTLGVRTPLVAVRQGATDYFILEFQSNDTLQAISATSSSVNTQLVTTSVYRDPSAWYQIVFTYDSTVSTPNSSSIYLSVNGVKVTDLSTATYPSQNTNIYYNIASVEHSIGRLGNLTTYADCYLTEINSIDGQALTPSSFGTTDAFTGAWIPMAYTGTYGTNGFYIDFRDNTSTTTLGLDYSGNANNWTANNISLTAGSTYDSMLDVPTPWVGYSTTTDTSAVTRGNYAVLNPLDYGGTGIKSIITEGNLKGFDAGSATLNSTSVATIGVTSGKFYCEFTSITAFVQAGILYGLPTSDITAAGIRYYGSNGIIYKDGVSQGTFSTYTTNDVIGLALDADAKTIAFYKNNTLVTTITYTSTNPVYFGALYPNQNNGGIYANFGQRPLSYTPPTGFKTLCTTNLPTPTILNGAEYMAATTYTGTGSARSVVNSGNNTTATTFQPDFVWVKGRSVAYSHLLTDSVRGVSKRLISDSTAAEVTDTDTLTAFNSNGFSWGTGIGGNQNAATYVAWQWKAGGTPAVTNTAGSITSTVSANTTAGFSVVTYTGTGSNATVGHGLGVAPRMLIVKYRSSTGDWKVYHASVGNTSQGFLNDTAAFQGSSPTVWNSTTPTSTVFSIGTNGGVNTNGGTYVAYCFAAVPGYSAFGSYTGNGSSDGPFVYCGFRPRWLMIKRTDTSGYGWNIYDTSRSDYNQAQQFLQANASSAETNNSAYAFDILSNGYKARNTDALINASGGTYIYAAFAENPFKYSNAR